MICRSFLGWICKIEVDQTSSSTNENLLTAAEYDEYCNG